MTRKRLSGRGKRPCRICRRWFRPNPRAGERQHVCSSAECQRERHRRACAEWREREKDADRRHQLRTKVLVSEPQTGTIGDLAGQVRWDGVRDAVGLQVAVIIEEIVKLIEIRLRDAVGAEIVTAQGFASIQSPLAPRDDIAMTGPGG